MTFPAKPASPTIGGLWDALKSYFDAKDGVAPPPPPSPARFLPGVNFTAMAQDNFVGGLNVGYCWPWLARMQAWAASGVKTIKVTVYEKWTWAGFQQCLDDAKTAGVTIVPDLFGKGKFQGAYITTAAQRAAFASFWGSFATTFGAHPALGGVYLMNEPDGGGAPWDAAIIQPAYTTLTDPVSNLVFAMDLYYDADGGWHPVEWGAGAAYDGGTWSLDMGARILSNFTAWLTANNKQGALSEYGVPNGVGISAASLANYTEAHKRTVAFLKATPRIVACFAWADDNEGKLNGDYSATQYTWLSVNPGDSRMVALVSG